MKNIDHNKRKNICGSALKVIVCLTAIVTASLFLLSCASAEEEWDTMPEEYASFIDAFPDSVRDALPDGVLSDTGDEVSRGAMEVSNPSYLLSSLWSLFQESLGRLLPTMALLCGTVVLSAVLYLLAGFFSSGMGRALDLCVRLCSFCIVSELAIVSLQRISNYFESLFGIVSGFLPLSGILYATGGNLTAAASGSLSLSAVLAVCEFFCAKTVIPVFCICLALSMLAAFEGVGAMAGQNLSGTVRKWYNTALGFVMMLMTTSLAAQSVISAKADGVAMKGMKFAVSGFVPISGGTVSSTLGTLAASVELLRGSVGVIGIFAILFLLLPVIIELAVLRGILSFASYFAGLLGCSGEQKLLNDVAGAYGYLEGVAVLAAAVFLIAMGIFAMTASAIGG